MPFDPSNIVFFSGSSHPSLSSDIVKHLRMPLGRCCLDAFPDGEIGVQIQENVRGCDAFIIQSIGLDPNTYLMELLIMIDALKRASARSIIPIIPYYGYCRQDRKDKPRVPITAKLVANLLETAGATRILTMDLHALQVQGFFDIPVDNLHARPPFVEAVRNLNLENFVVVTPDVGSIKLARSFAEPLGVNLAIVDKRRLDAENVEVTTVIGEVSGQNVLLVDDMVTTAGTLVNAAEACRDAGALRIIAAVTHPVLVGDAVEKINNSCIEMVLVSDTVPIEGRIRCDKIRQVSVASLFAEAAKCVLTGQSISSLFELPVLH
jgi:ribose-phosphate pyrophosphokinase